MGKIFSRKRFKNWTIGFGAVFLFLLFVSQFDIVSVILRDILEDRLNEELEQEVDIVQLKLQPFQLGVDLEGVSIKDKSGAITVIPNSFIRLQLPIDKPLIRSIVVNNPSIHVQIEPRKEKKEITLPDNFPFDNIQIKNAEIRLEGEGFDYYGSGFSLIYHKGTVDFWTEERTKLQINERKIKILPFQWENIRVEPNLIDFEKLLLETSVMDIVGDMTIEEDSVSGTIKLLSRLSHWVKSEKISVDGLAEIEISPAGTLSEFALDVNTKITDITIARQGRDRILNHEISKLTAEFSWQDEKFYIHHVEWPWAGGVFTMNGSVVPETKELVVNLDSQGTNCYQFFQDLDMSDAPWVGMDFVSVLNLKGTYSPFVLEGDFHLRGQDFISAGGNIKRKKALLRIPEANLDGTFYVDQDKMIYDLSNFELEKTKGKIRAEFTFTYPNIASIEYEFPLFDFSEMAPLGGSEFRGRGYLNGRMQGPIKKLSLESYGKVRNFSLVGIPYADELEFQAKGTSLKEIDLLIPKARKNESPMFGQMHISFRPEIVLQGLFETEGGSANDFMSIFFTPLDVDANTIGQVKLSGPTSNLNIEADFQLKDATLWGEPFDFGEFHLRMNKDLMTLEEISLQRNDGIGSVFMRGTRKDGNNNFEVLAGAIPIEYSSLLVEKNSPIRGKVDLFAKIQGESFIPSGTIQVRDIWYGLQPIGEGTVLFFEQGDHMEYQVTMEDSLKIHGRSGYSLDEDYLFHFQSNDFPVHVVTQQSFNGDWLTGELSSKGYVQQKEQELSGYALVTDLQVKWKERSLSSPEVWTMTWAEDEIDFSPVHIVGSGKTDFIFQGKRAQKKNDFQAGGKIDMRVLEMIMPYTHRANGLIDFTASLGQYGLMANLDVEQGFLEGDWFPHSIEDISSSIQIFDDAYQIDSLQARIGGGEVDMSGSIEARDLQPELFDLEMKFSDSRMQLIDWLPAVLGDGQLKVTGPFDYPMISGDVMLKEMNFTDRIDWEDAVITFAPSALSGSSEESKGYFQYDINVTADDTIRIRNNLADMYASADLKFIGDLAKPGMLGEVQLSENGRALFKERDFEILRGELRYEDPFSFDPMLDIAMKTVVNTGAQDYEIEYYVTDYYSNWQTRTSSNPALPQADINALLLFGMTREELEIQGGLGSALAIEGSDLLVSKFGVVQRFNEVGEGIFQSELLRLDRIDLISGATDRNSAYVSSALRILAEKDIGEGTIRLEQSVTETSDIFVSWEQQIAKRLYTRLYWSSQQQGRYLNTNGAFGAEFELQWELD